MKFLFNKFTSSKELFAAFWKENKSAIFVGIIVTIVGGYILFLITSDSNTKQVANIDNSEYFDKGTIPKAHSIDATDEYRKINELNAGSPISKFQEILGEHSFVNNLSNDVIEYVFVSPLYYVEAAVNLDKTVVFYSVTTRKQGFNPKFEFGSWYADTNEPLIVELGKTTYSELDTMFRSNPQYAAYTSGVNWFYYFESYYVGRPGNYQSFVFSINQSGFYRSGSWDYENDQSDWPSLNPSHYIIDNTDLYSDTAIYDEEWIDYRKHAVINTYTETIPFYSINDVFTDLSKEYFGPNLQQVRLIE